MAPRVTYYRYTYSYDCGDLVLQWGTTRPTHLWLILTARKPMLDPWPDQEIPTPSPHRNFYRFLGQQLLEQIEPGDTFVHTWRVPFPATTSDLYAVAVNSNNPAEKKSISPILSFHLNVGPVLWQENWTAPLGDHGPYPVQQQAFFVRPYELLLDNRSAPNVPTVQIGYPFGTTSPLVDEDLCNLTLTISLSENTEMLGQIHVGITLLFVLANPFGTDARFIENLWDADPPFTGQTPSNFLSEQLGPSNPTRPLTATIPLRRVVDGTYNPQFPSLYPARNPRLTGFQIGFDTISIPVATAGSRATLGPLTINGAATITDNSANWRTARASQYALYVP